MVLVKNINSIEELEEELEKIRRIFKTISSSQYPFTIKYGTALAFQQGTEVQNMIVILLIKYLTGTLSEKKLIEECMSIFRVMEALDGKPTKRIF